MKLIFFEKKRKKKKEFLFNSKKENIVIDFNEFISMSIDFVCCPKYRTESFDLFDLNR